MSSNNLPIHLNHLGAIHTKNLGSIHTKTWGLLIHLNHLGYGMVPEPWPLVWHPNRPQMTSGYLYSGLH